MKLTIPEHLRELSLLNVYVLQYAMEKINEAKSLEFFELKGRKREQPWFLPPQTLKKLHWRAADEIVNLDNWGVEVQPVCRALGVAWSEGKKDLIKDIRSKSIPRGIEKLGIDADVLCRIVSYLPVLEHCHELDLDVAQREFFRKSEYADQLLRVFPLVFS